MRYFGSKALTSEWIVKLIQKHVPTGTVCDPFGGLGIVGASLKKAGYEVWTGDVLRFAHYFQVARLVRHRQAAFRGLRNELGLSGSASVTEYLNSLRPKDSWVTREYSQERRFFLPENARKIDACRLEIKKWSSNGNITASERAILLASLVNCMDAVANTAGTYYSYLKAWYRKALRPFSFRLVQPAPGSGRCRSYLEDARLLVKKRTYDVLYLDPPYTERSYSHYYHLPESIAGQITPKVHGVSGIPQIPIASEFSRPPTASDALQELLSGANWRMLVVHYMDGGMIPPTVLRRILSQYGHVMSMTISTNGYKAVAGSREVAQRIYVVAR